jgi:Fe-Mn family superoxide dismutase
MPFVLPPLPYQPDALEPFLSRQTIKLHHEEHQATYVSNLNHLITGTRFQETGLENIIRLAEGPVFNNASQVWNHTFYFESMIPKKGNSLTGPFSRIITGSFGSMQYFRENFIKAGITLFGSGWVWLYINPKGSVQIAQEYNAGNPLRKGLMPLLNCDVWEHGYYLDYRNRRGDYINAFLNLVNWEVIEKRYTDARKYN